MKLLACFVAFCLMGTVAHAQVIAGTHVSRTEADIACDAAYQKAHDTDGKTNDYNEQRKECLMASGDYDVMIWAMNTKHTQQIERQTITLYEVACLYQTADAYHELGEDADGKVYAEMAYKLYDKIHMGYWARLNHLRGSLSVDTRKIDFQNSSPALQAKLTKALTPAELKLNLNFQEIMKQVYILYPDMDPDASPSPSPSPDGFIERKSRLEVAQIATPSPAPSLTPPMSSPVPAPSVSPLPMASPVPSSTPAPKST